jgi:meso-butanediol dehydrogenase/(S,S)-butanediol dehydrogenase/diacetyl reductase
LATASTSGLRGDPGNYAYNASKAAVFNLVRAAAVDLGVYGIRVNGVAPGPVETGITERLKGLPGAMDEMAKRIPLRRWGQPHELAEAFFFLASPAASFITGTTLMVDGGHSAHAAHFDLRDKA